MAALLAAVVLAGCRPWPGSSFVERKMDTELQAKEVVFDFLGKINRGGGHSKGEVQKLLGNGSPGKDVNVGELWTFKSPLGEFWVSKHAGYVSYYSQERSGAPVKSVMRASEARRLATEFVKLAYPAFDPRRFEARIDPSGAGEYRVEYEQQKLGGEVSIFSNFISVVLRSDNGHVREYRGTCLPFVRTDRPRVSEERVRKIILGDVSSKKKMVATIKSLKLVEWPVDRARRSRTVWMADVSYRGPRVREGVHVRYSKALFIDADTGHEIKWMGLEQQW